MIFYSAALAVEHGRHVHEGFLEAASIFSELDDTLKNVTSWMEPVDVPTPMLIQPGSSKIVYQPKGVMLIIVPWNFPIYLAFSGIIGAISAGNACVVKPSEITPKCSKVIEEIITKSLDPKLVRVVLGGVPETTALLRVRWDHILYTGSGAVGRVVYQAASKYLTPVTLELGGKSPVYVDKTAKIDVAVNRILSTKLTNCGQICIAPDYCLVHETVIKEFVETLKQRAKTWLGDQPQKSESYSRIINTHHFDRIKRLLEDNHGGEIIYGGLSIADRSNRFIPPTIVVNPNPNSSLMQEEIFGPVLPILVVHDENEAIDFINARESPLALYVFSETTAVQDKCINNTLAGGSTINDCLLHVGNTNMPFGGVGTSGLGAYHGKFGFDEFSHKRSVLNKATWIDPAVRYMPYKAENVEMMKKVVIGPLIPPHIKNALMVSGALGVGMIMMKSML